MSSSSHDSQNLSEGGSYAAGSGEAIASPSPSGRSSSADDLPIGTLVQSTGDSAQSSRALTIISSSPEPIRVAPAPASVNPPAPMRAPSQFSGALERGRPSPMVQETTSTLTEADLERICRYYKIDRNRFKPLLPLPGQTAFDPPRDYEPVYEDYSSRASAFLFLSPLPVLCGLMGSGFLKFNQMASSLFFATFFFSDSLSFHLTLLFSELFLHVGPRTAGITSASEGLALIFLLPSIFLLPIKGGRKNSFLF